jgi:alkanesulfonate monooxygenase SsuD/methylene tetrahydromethanopterin reductase-like flavin-dependent oxidoreductase (luciferase family)
MARAVKDRIVSVDGWVAAPWAPDVVESDWTDVREHAEATGRDPQTLDRSLATYVHVVPDADADRAEAEQRRVLGSFVEDGGVDFAYRHYLTGTVDDIRDQLAAYEDLGIQETIVFPVAEGAAAQDRQLELLADLVKPLFR